MERIRFKDLSIMLKLAVIGGYISIVSFTIGFIYGFIGAL